MAMGDMRDKRRVLVVDDSATVCRMVEKLLRMCGFEEIETVQDGASALDRLTVSPFEIIICDWEMESVNGLDVLRELRRRQETRAIPFILMSARKEPRWVAEAMAAGADCLIAKPFDAATLRAKIAQISFAGRGGGIRDRVLI
jgi:two-component system, chemotaxis family, chemotaxis protein CheY